MNTDDRNRALKRQYATAGNFQSRVDLNVRFSTNPYGWNRWVFDQIRFPEQTRVLELGCGNALLWLANLQRVPPDAAVCLSDFSVGMLEDAKQNLGEAAERFAFREIDAHQIPFPAGNFDIVIANHMLYHMTDRPRALSEISRVLKAGGVHYATTVGLTHMQELTHLVAEFDPGLRFSLAPVAAAFGLENGEQQLRPHFRDVTLCRYADGLVVTEAEPLVGYVLSIGRVRQALGDERVPAFREHVERALAEHGSLRITKAVGLFIATK